MLHVVLVFLLLPLGVFLLLPLEQMLVWHFLDIGSQTEQIPYLQNLL